MTTILVTGATGRTGGQAVAQLAALGVKVRALVRDPAAARLPEGVEAVRGDLTAPESLEGALAGVEGVFLVWPTLAADHAAPETIRTIGERAGRVVYVSARGADPGQPAGTILGSHAYIERLIEKTGVRHTFLRPGGFASNTLWWAPQIRAGAEVVRWFHAGAGRALIHEADIAAVGVRALTEDGHDGARYVLSGPEVVTQAEQVHAIGEAIGRPLRYEEEPPERAVDTLVAEGWPREVAEGIVGFHGTLVSEPEGVTDTVARITGSPARSYREWAGDHAADFR
ncbi:uncharacterized protein YbjT (DUF2867 family) [Thermocatellispora tengchongensis]|uniref:Uncharacterized protein YbjT (DUF2867 family) n=1 Tax=Thermocatellispora tengchongensis TaxID=1073253 RepID=A0A840P3Z7_9ACTN|nr:NmrA family NAD(P)-binding protein [Thermocatellispora tengchongensis]MBB5132200.1 uncharacterized protein YbjT (DUF2867 family) [Thermocatellispora tengchongensis]